jgi:hypothetical protein
MQLLPILLMERNHYAENELVPHSLASSLQLYHHDYHGVRLYRVNWVRGVQSFRRLLLECCCEEVNEELPGYHYQEHADAFRRYEYASSSWMD